MKRADAAAAPFGRARPGFGLHRHRRLLALCGLSVLVHFALLQLFAARMPEAPRSAAADKLVVRLAPPASAPVPDAAVASAAAAARAEAPARHAIQPAPRTDPRPDPAPPAASAAARSATPAAASSTTPPAPPSAPTRAPGTPANSARIPAAVRWDVVQAPAPESAAASGAEPSAAPLVQMPGRYRVRMPDAVQLTYLQTRQAPGTAAKPVRVPDAHIDWRSDGARYAMQMDGVLGRLGSRGASGDAGIVPRSAVEERDGARLATEFTPDGRILFGARGAGASGNIGHQDRASLLMQLAGIGLGEPGQMQDVIEVVVAGATDAAVVRFQVMEAGTLATPLGAIDAVRLAQRGAPGQARLEVWLAPGRGWLPVQLRVTGPDGAVATQTLRAIATGSAPPAE